MAEEGTIVFSLGSERNLGSFGNFLLCMPGCLSAASGVLEAWVRDRAGFGVRGGRGNGFRFFGLAAKLDSFGNFSVVHTGMSELLHRGVEGWVRDRARFGFVAEEGNGFRFFEFAAKLGSFGNFLLGIPGCLKFRHLGVEAWVRNRARFGFVAEEGTGFVFFGFAAKLGSFGKFLLQAPGGPDSAAWRGGDGAPLWACWVRDRGEFGFVAEWKTVVFRFGFRAKLGSFGKFLVQARGRLDSPTGRGVGG